MKRTLQRTLASEKRKIERRLGDAVRVNDGGPVLSGPNIRYELGEKTKAIASGGIGAIHRLVQQIGLAARIDTAVTVFKIHQPYHESDHVLNIAYNILCGGRRSTTSSCGAMTECFSTRWGPPASRTRPRPGISVGGSTRTALRP